MYNTDLKQSLEDYKPKITKIVKETKRILDKTGTIEDKINIIHSIFFNKPKKINNEPHCYYINANNSSIDYSIVKKINEYPVYLDLSEFNELGYVDITLKIIYNSGKVYVSNLYNLKL